MGSPALIACECGVLASKGYALWSQAERDAKDGLAGEALAVLHELRAAIAFLG